MLGATGAVQFLLSETPATLTYIPWIADDIPYSVVICTASTSTVPPLAINVSRVWNTGVVVWTGACTVMVYVCHSALNRCV